MLSVSPTKKILHQFFANARNSLRVARFSLKAPNKQDVTIVPSFLRTPRQHMHWCFPSIITATPFGLRTRCKFGRDSDRSNVPAPGAGAHTCRSVAPTSRGRQSCYSEDKQCVPSHGRGACDARTSKRIRYRAAEPFRRTAPAWNCVTRTSSARCS